MSNRFLVLCSGGLDSTGALLKTVRDHGRENVSVLAFRYAQPAADMELAASERAARALGVPWHLSLLLDCMKGGIVERVLPSGVLSSGVNNANVPARNLVFLAHGISRAGFLWPDDCVSIVIGAHVDDAETFPDCRKEFLDHAEGTGTLALKGVVASVGVVAPWIAHKKSDILRHFANDEDALTILRDSVSCYLGTRCGTCGACVQRAQAFNEAGIEDGTGTTIMMGGDPSRESRIGIR